MAGGFRFYQTIDDFQEFVQILLHMARMTKKERWEMKKKKEKKVHRIKIGEKNRFQSPFLRISTPRSLLDTLRLLRMKTKVA